MKCQQNMDALFVLLIPGLWIIYCTVESNVWSILIASTEEGGYFFMSYLGIPVYRDHAIAAYLAYFAKMRISHIFPHIMAFSKFQIFIYAFRISIYAYNRIFPHMRSHFSAFLRILSNVNTRARIIYATYFRNATYMPHVHGIF